VRLQHVSIPIPADGRDRALSFYRDTLGLEERYVPPKLDAARFLWFRLGPPDLELHLMLTESPPHDQRHLCVAVDDLASIRARLEAAGVETSEATEIVGRPRFFCRDPFGNLLELAQIDSP